jgi:hypothetical protein
MILSEDQLSVILQASLDRAKELLEQTGGFLPFGARAKVNGDVEFLEAEGAREQEPLDALYRRIGALLAEDARRHEIIASTLVANANLPAELGGGFQTAVAVLVEAPEFCRSVVVPYSAGGEGVIFGEFIPEEAAPVVFAG